MHQKDVPIKNVYTRLMRSSGGGGGGGGVNCLLLPEGGEQTSKKEKSCKSLGSMHGGWGGAWLQVKLNHA